MCSEKNDFNGYELSRNWFDFCFENPEKINPSHTALYFFIIEHCNRLGWKEKFGLPTQMTMDAIGVKNWRTYSKSFNDLVEFGFINVIQSSKNQYSATVIALVKNTKANTKALTKAMQKHIQKQSKSIAVIDKPNNQEPITIEQDIGDKSPTQKSFKNFSEKEFIDEISQYKDIFERDLLNSFFKHWKEKSPGGKMRFQLEKTWETKLRLEKWKSNQQKFNNNGSTKTSYAPNNSKNAGRNALADDIAIEIGVHP